MREAFTELEEQSRCQSPELCIVCCSWILKCDKESYHIKNTIDFCWAYKSKPYCNVYEGVIELKHFVSYYVLA